MPRAKAGGNSKAGDNLKISNSDLIRIQLKIVAKN
jgi:hypothetical protein